MGNSAPTAQPLSIRRLAFILAAAAVFTWGGFAYGKKQPPTSASTAPAPLTAAESVASAIPSTTTPRAAAPGLHVKHVRGVRIAFPSSSTGEIFCRFSAEEIGPAHRKLGPFRIAAPGVAVTAPAVVFPSDVCTPNDWADVLDYLRALPSAAQHTPVSWSLPDGTVARSTSRPRVEGDSLFVSLSPPPDAAHNGSGAPRKLRIRHDGVDRLRFSLTSR